MSLHQQHHTFDDLEVQHPWKQQQRPATATATTLRRQQQEAKEEEEAIHLWVEESRLLMLGLGVSSPSPPLTPAPNTAPDLFWFGGEDRDHVQGIVRCYENLLKIREGWPTRAPTIFVAHVERHALALPEVAHVLRDVLVGPVDGHPPQVDDLIHAVFTGLRRAFHPPVKCELGGHQQRKRNEAPALPPRSHRLPHVLPLDLESESDVFFSLDRIQVCILRIDGYAVPFEVFRTIYAVTMHDVSEAVPILVYPLQFCGPEEMVLFWKVACGPASYLYQLPMAPEDHSFWYDCSDQNREITFACQLQDGRLLKETPKVAIPVLSESTNPPAPGSAELDGGCAPCDGQRGPSLSLCLDPILDQVEDDEDEDEDCSMQHVQDFFAEDWCAALLHYPQWHHTVMSTLLEGCCCSYPLELSKCRSLVLSVIFQAEFLEKSTHLAEGMLFKVECVSSSGSCSGGCSPVSSSCDDEDPFCFDSGDEEQGGWSSEDEGADTSSESEDVSDSDAEDS